MEMNKEVITNASGTTSDNILPIALPQAALPAKPVEGRGFESGYKADDLIIPRAKLIQALSPEITEGVPGAKPGAILNSLTKEILPSFFIPFLFFKNYMKFNPRQKEDPSFDQNLAPGAEIWRSSNPNDPRVIAEAGFGPNGEKPTAITFLNFVSYFPGIEMPVIIGFSKTSFKAGKELLSLARFSNGDMFARKYKLESRMEKNDISTFAVYKVTPAGKSSDEEFAICENYWKMFSGKFEQIKVHDSETDESVPF